MRTVLCLFWLSCRAQAAGKQRQIVEVINPINEKANNFLATGVHSNTKR